jgi:hypothetical protein
MAAGASALVRKLTGFLPLQPDELASLAGLEARRRPIAAHTEIVHERQEGHHAFILRWGSPPSTSTASCGSCASAAW